jgi:hypothetical protein
MKKENAKVQIFPFACDTLKKRKTFEIHRLPVIVMVKGYRLMVNG